MENSISVSRGINASSAVVWSLASDLPRMGEWSNENAGGKWVSGADGPVPARSSGAAIATGTTAGARS